VLSVLCVSAVVGCRNTGALNSPHDPAVSAQLCQSRSRLTIGFHAGGNLVALNSCNLDINHSIKFEEAPKGASVYSSTSPESPDHNWLVKEETKGLILQSTSRSNPDVPIQTPRLLSSPQWSPDSAFFFVWAAEDRSRGRSLSECLDDVSDLYVFSSRSGTGTLVGRVCSGVPTDAFQWLSS
jgi:hypothetical protein